MASVSTYLNFQGNTEEAFNFYKSVFKTDFMGQISRYKDIPPQDGMPPIPEKEIELYHERRSAHYRRPYSYGTDSPEFMGKPDLTGTNMPFA